MMTGIFGVLFAAFIANWLGWRRVAVGLIAVCLFLSLGLFLFEIYSPETGFRMPWLRAGLPESVIEHGEG